MARTWLVDSRGIAKKVKNATQSSTYQSKEWGIGAHRECPKCKHRIDNSDVSVEWPGLPAGVKFDPSDLELLEHLAGKVGVENSKPHALIDDFIPTLEGNEGICYTHPENLPGVKKDGSRAHFFHQTSNAYSTGCRKRRRIQKGHNVCDEHVRWHKTGKTRPVIENGIQKGCKKIMVLYRSSKKSKPDKTNWVMHQYHLGTDEDEKGGELVVSKIFYQQQSSHAEKNDMEPDIVGTSVSPISISDEQDLLGNRVDPKTPKTTTPDPPRPRTSFPYDEDDEDILQGMPSQGTCFAASQSHCSPIRLNDKALNPPWLAGESQAVEDPNPTDLDASLLCHEVLDSFHPLEESGLKQIHYNPDSDRFGNSIHETDPNTFSGIPDLHNMDIDTPPDFNLSDLQFGSQESIMSWLDRL